VRSLVYLVATSLDGFIAAPDRDFTPLMVGGDHLAGLAEDYPETFPAPAREALGIDAPNRVFDTVLMGARTYQVPGAVPSPYPQLRQVVFSSRAPAVPGDVEVVDGDAVAYVRRLKADGDGGDLWLCGGAHLAGQLYDEIDRLVLKISPVVLGNGLPLFAGVNPRPRTFLPRRQVDYDNGVRVVTYEGA
jgi:dihydrofolate reductase